MKTKIPKLFMSLPLITVHKDAAVANDPLSYLIGGIIALLIMGYLIYTLLRPEKF
jgi:K+-transporting ATPase KdpF subunit